VIRAGTKTRLLLTLLAGAIALALAAPGAGAATQTRHYEDRSVSGGGNLRIDVVFKDKNGNRKFTARRLTLFYVEILPISCNPGGEQFAAIVRPTSIKLTKGRFVLPIQDPNFDGQASGKMIKRGSKANGALNVRDFDPSPDVQNCTTNGPRSWVASRCRTPNQNLKIPICRF
jgi:hypothetical protein